MTTDTVTGDLSGTSTAVIDGAYRYLLTRQRPGSGPPLVMGMLNPSKADHEINDPTVVRCIALADRENASALIIFNLFGLRATIPANCAGTVTRSGRTTASTSVRCARRECGWWPRGATAASSTIAPRP